jgi:uncharacterized membrane protein YdjX (TVP38/TMEM64 family)
VPIAPFTVVNLVAGASHISFRHFTIGTIIGEIPGLTAMSVFADQISTALLHPGPKTFILLGVVGAAIIAGTWALRGWLDRKTSEE